MYQTKSQPLKHQRGITLTGLIFSLAILVLLAMLGMKVGPTVIEYSSIKKAISEARQAGPTPYAIRAAFDKQADVGYISSISGKDLQISGSGDDVVVSFSYEKKIPLFGPVTLLIQYDGTTARGGAAPKRIE